MIKENTLRRQSSLNPSAPKLLQFLFLLYIFVKPFYIFESGSFQPGDIVFVACFFVFLYYIGEGNLLNSKFDYILVAFVMWVFIVNFVYFSLYRQTEFIMSTLYYIFNLALVFVARFLLLDKSFLRKLFWTCRISLYLQIVIYFLRLGKYYIDENGVTDRYLGTFNDPNQLAFYMFCLLMVMYMVEMIHGVNCRVNLIDYAAFVFILYLTASTGMLLAFAIFVALYVVLLLVSPLFEVNSDRKRKLLFALLGLAIIVAVYLIFRKEISVFFQKSELFSRLLEKETLSASTSRSEISGTSIWQDRNIDKVYIYPQYNIFGAGQGYFERFWQAHSSGEIHSTLLSILFCYGIVPTFLFLYWIWTNIRHSTVYYFPVFIALAVESITLLNQRQPLFWLMFMLAYTYRVMEDRRYEDAVYS